MAVVGLLFAHHGAAGGSEPMASLEVAGLASVTRQIRLLRSLGIERIFIVAERMPPGLAIVLMKIEDDIFIVRDAAQLAAELTDEHRVFVIEEGLLVDEAVPKALLANPSRSVLAVWHESHQVGAAERLDSGTFWAGLAVYEGRLVRTVAEHLGEWDLQSTLLRTAAGEGAARFDVTCAPDYAPERWLTVRNLDDARRASDIFVDAARTDARDWPTRYVHLPIETAAVRMLLPTRTSARLLLALSGGCAVTAAVAFAGGWLWTGLFLALLSFQSRGIAERLARIRAEKLPNDQARKWLENSVGYGWYVGLAYHFSGLDRASGPWVTAAMIVLFMIAADLQRSFFYRTRSHHLADMGPAERRLQLMGAGHTTLAWMLLPFAAAGAWYAGFVVLAGYSAATFFAVQQRLFTQLQR